MMITNYPVIYAMAFKAYVSKMDQVYLLFVAVILVLIVLSRITTILVMLLPIIHLVTIVRPLLNLVLILNTKLIMSHLKSVVTILLSLHAR